MNSQINIEDNIFVVNLQVRMIRDMLALDTDPELFLKKTLEDLEFTGGTLAVLLENMENNTQLVGRNVQLENLSETEWQLSRVLSEILNGTGSLSVARFPLIREKVLILRNASDERRGRIDRYSFLGNESSPEPVVSGAELSELLKEMG